ncbi:MAG: hypothetical protein DWQ19_12805 [Crenarchaeota archaeon]|nr:MAG: hypothetical protein DWQ19_12805 [Thermoproteota archaeon]
MLTIVVALERNGVQSANREKAADFVKMMRDCATGCAIGDPIPAPTDAYGRRLKKISDIESAAVKLGLLKVLDGTHLCLTEAGKLLGHAYAQLQSD